jgi:hypothetical protein
VKISWFTIFGLTLAQITYAALPEIPVGNLIFFGYSQYLPSFYLALIILGIFSLSVSIVLFRLKSSNQSKYLQIIRALYAANILAVTIKAFILFSGWTWSGLRDKFFPNILDLGKVFWEIWPVIIAFVIFYLMGRVSPKALKFLGVLGCSLFLMLTLRIVSNNEQIYTPSWSSIGTQSQKSSHTRKVIWIIFDEFDPQIAFDQKNINKLPHFKELLKTSVFHSNLYGPSNATHLSVPAMLTGLKVRDVKFEGTGKIKLEKLNGEWILFDYANSIFSQLELAGFNSSILGFYLPYCEIFKRIKCNAYPWSYQYRPWSALEFTYGLRSIINGILTQPHADRDPMAAITRSQYENLESVIRDSESDFIFLHLNIPHLPGNYSRYILNERNQDPYIANLHLTDVFLEKILHSINLQGDKKTLLILSSDHWKRSSSSEPKPALFIASFIGKYDASIKIESTSSGIYIKDIVSGYLNGKISSNKDIAEFFKDNNVNLLNNE